MDYAKLGRSGLEVSRLCLGMMSFGGGSWHLDEDQAEPIVRAAVESGITFFDTADVYADGASERLTGRLLPKYLRREDMVVATKVYMGTGPGKNDAGLGRKHILAAIDASLSRLGMDYVDLYQIHRYDPTTPIEETMEVLGEVVKSGKVRYLGASTMWSWQFMKAQQTARSAHTPGFISMQNHYNLLYREEEREMVAACQDQGAGLLPYSPLARGLLAGNRGRDGEQRSARAKTDDLAERLASPADFDVIDQVVGIAGAMGRSPAQVALAWLRERPGVVAPIVGATRVDHVKEAVASLDVHLTNEEVERLEAPYTPHAPMGQR